MTDDDDLIWQQVTADIKKSAPTKHILSKPQKKITHRDHSDDMPLYQNYHHNLELGGISDIDANTMRRFKREKFGINASLDLHGLKTDEAYQAVRRFIIQSFNNNLRAVLIITGKGLSHPNEDIFEPKGVLKQLILEWIQTDDLKPMILTYIHPSQKLGGEGALYLLLRRKKQNQAPKPADKR